MDCGTNIIWYGISFIKVLEISKFKDLRKKI
jgi:hypothetical protein